MSARRRPLPLPPQPSTSSAPPVFPPRQDSHRSPQNVESTQSQSAPPKRSSIDKSTINLDAVPEESHIQINSHHQDEDLLEGYENIIGYARIPRYDEISYHGHEHIPASPPTAYEPTHQDPQLAPLSTISPSVSRPSGTNLTPSRTTSPTCSSFPRALPTVPRSLSAPNPNPNPPLSSSPIGPAVSRPPFSSPSGTSLDRAPSYRTATSPAASFPPPPVPSLPPQYLANATTISPPTRPGTVSQVSASARNQNILPSFNPHHETYRPRTESVISGKLIFPSATGGKMVGFYNQSVGGLLGENQLGGGTSLGVNNKVKGKMREDAPQPLPRQSPSRQNSLPVSSLPPSTVPTSSFSNITTNQGTYMVAVPLPNSESPVDNSYPAQTPPVAPFPTPPLPYSTHPTTSDAYPSYSPIPTRPSVQHQSIHHPHVGSFSEPVVSTLPHDSPSLSTSQRFSAELVSRPSFGRELSSDGSHGSSVEALTIRRTGANQSRPQSRQQQQLPSQSHSQQTSHSQQKMEEVSAETEVWKRSSSGSGNQQEREKEEYWKRVRELQSDQYRASGISPLPSDPLPQTANGSQNHSPFLGRLEEGRIQDYEYEESMEGGKLVGRKKNLESLLGEDLRRWNVDSQTETQTQTQAYIPWYHAEDSIDSDKMSTFRNQSVVSLPDLSQPFISRSSSYTSLSAKVQSVSISAPSHPPSTNSIVESLNLEPSPASSSAYESYAPEVVPHRQLPSKVASHVASSILSRFVRSSGSSLNTSIDRSLSVSSSTYSPLSPIRDSVTPIISHALSKLPSFNPDTNISSRSSGGTSSRKRKASSRGSSLLAGGAKRNDSTSPESLWSLPEGAEMEQLQTGLSYDHTPIPHRESTTSLPSGFVDYKHSLTTMSRVDSVRSARSTGMESFQSDHQPSPLDSEYDSSRDSHIYPQGDSKVLMRNSSDRSKNSRLYADGGFGSGSEAREEGSLSRNTSMSSREDETSFEEEIFNHKGSMTTNAYELNQDEAYRHETAGSMLHTLSPPLEELTLPDIQGIGLSIDPFFSGIGSGQDGSIGDKVQSLTLSSTSPTYDGGDQDYETPSSASEKLKNFDARVSYYPG